MPYKDPDKARESNRKAANKQYKKDPDKFRERSRKNRSKDLSKGRMDQLKRRYGLTLEDYDRLLESQGGVCAICKTNTTGSSNKGRFCVDHDHATGKVRGLLCSSCNTGLGYFKDSQQFLRSSVRYLNKCH